MSVLYVYGSICMYMYQYAFMYVYVRIVRICHYVGISQRQLFRYRQKLTYTDNMYKYQHTYRICTTCKCTFLFAFLSEYDTIRDCFWKYVRIRTTWFTDGRGRDGVMEVDGVVEFASGVDIGLWMPFCLPRGGEKEGQQRREGRLMVSPAATVATQ